MNRGRPTTDQLRAACAWWNGLVPSALADHNRKAKAEINAHSLSADNVARYWLAHIQLQTTVKDIT